MPVDSDIKDTVRLAIEGDLQAPKVPKERLPRLRNVWGCEGAHDFLYGNRSGYYAGLAEGLMIERHKRVLTKEETEEVFQLIKPYLEGLRRYFSHYKQARKKK